MEKLLNAPIILASQSPRRLSLLQSLQLNVEAVPTHVEEDFDIHLPPQEIAISLAERKAKALAEKRKTDREEFILAADTIVVLDQSIINKPDSPQQAVDMLRRLSGRMHEVITGVCILYGESSKSFAERTKVYFAPLTTQEIDYYVDKFKPLDKAGAYGIQEWIGMIGVEKIEGDFYNVMGLPIQKVFQTLKYFLNE